MSALVALQEAGIQASIDKTGGLRLKGLSKLDREHKIRIIEFARNHKQPIIAALSQTGAPGECESCPAAGYWDYSTYAGQGLICFHRAYYLGKSGRPNPCHEVRAACPRK